MPGTEETIQETKDSLDHSLICHDCGLVITISMKVGGRSMKQSCSGRCITGCDTLNRVKDRAYKLIEQFSYKSSESIRSSACEASEERLPLQGRNF